MNDGTTSRSPKLHFTVRRTAATRATWALAVGDAIELAIALAVEVEATASAASFSMTTCKATEDAPPTAASSSLSTAGTLVIVLGGGAAVVLAGSFVVTFVGAGAVEVKSDTAAVLVARLGAEVEGGRVAVAVDVVVPFLFPPLFTEDEGVCNERDSDAGAERLLVLLMTVFVLDAVEVLLGEVFVLLLVKLPNEKAITFAPIPLQRLVTKTRPVDCWPMTRMVS